MERSTKIRVIVCAGLIILSMVLGFILSPRAMNNDTSSATYLTDKRTEVLELAAASAASSVAITALPGDAGTPIAEELARLSGYFTVILTAIYFEKFLAAVAGTAALKFLIPFALLCIILGLWRLGDRMQRAGEKLLIFGLVLLLVVPFSVKLSQAVEKNILAPSEAETEQVAEEYLPAENTPVPEESKKPESTQDIVSVITGFITDTAENIAQTASDAADTVTGAVSEKIEAGKDLLNRLVDQIAALIITSCVIPIAVLLVLIWVLKILFSVDIKMPDRAMMRRR